MRLSGLILCFIVCLPCFVNAQAKLSPGEIKKIHLIDSEWALGFSRLTEFDIVNENNKWNCYQIKQKYTWDPLDKNKDYYAKQNSEQRKFVKKINAEAINGLFKTISTVKPAHNWQIYALPQLK
ncbi:MAG: hypothetical protein ABIN13_19245 [Mucilaginibacter sp.]